MSVLEDIALNRFIATDEQVEQLSWHYIIAVDTVKRSKSTFMQILLAMAQEAGGELKHLTEVYNRLYPAVKRGIEKAGYQGDEAESKAIFARTAMSTLKGYIKRGGDLSDLDPATVTKRQLQPQSISTPKLERIENRVIVSIRAMAKTDEEQAIHELENYIAALRMLRKELKGSVKVVSHTLERHASH